MGPFIDANHPLIKSGNISQMPFEIFRDRISAGLGVLMEEIPELTVVLVPSIRDLVSERVVYPQAAFKRDFELGIPRVSR